MYGRDSSVASASRKYLPNTKPPPLFVARRPSSMLPTTPPRPSKPFQNFRRHAVRIARHRSLMMRDSSQVLFMPIKNRFTNQDWGISFSPRGRGRPTKLQERCTPHVFTETIARCDASAAMHRPRSRFIALPISADQDYTWNLYLRLLGFYTRD